MSSENEKLNKIMNSPNFKVQCNQCNSILISKNSNQLKKCQCGKISIDGGKNKSERRLVGDLDFVDIIDE